MTSVDTRGLEARLAARIQQEGIPGFSTAVVKGDRVLWAKGFGLADLAARTPAAPGTIWMWFSMTKIVTATAVMQLYERGKLDLEDPVREYVPTFPSSREPATIRQLLNHTSGLANPIPVGWVHPADEPGPEPEAFAKTLLARYSKLKSHPGAEVRYSNLGYVALGEVISEASGRPYAEFVGENILAPLEMNRSGFAYTAEMIRAAATGYIGRWSPMAMFLRFLVARRILGKKVGRFVALNRFYVDGAAYGGLLGPVTDAARFVMVHLNGGKFEGHRLLSEESVAQMQRISDRGKRMDVGLGWYRLHSGPSRDGGYLESVGGGGGFLNVMQIHPDQKLGIVVMSNVTKFDYHAILDAISRVDWT